jgi:hypothetical protein
MKLPRASLLVMPVIVACCALSLTRGETASSQPATDVPMQWVGLWGAFDIEQGKMLDKDYCKRIECVIEHRDGQWHANFEGECGRPYKYSITMQGRAIDGVLMFEGTVDLGPEDGGVYDWIGRADGEHFVGFYTNAHTTGVFRMTPRTQSNGE